MGWRATAKFGGYRIFALLFFGRTIWTGDSDGPHNLASPLSPLLYTALRGLANVSSRSGAEKSLPTHRQTPATPFQPGHWGLERDFTTSSMQSAIPRGEEEPGLVDQLRHTHKSDDIPFPLWNFNHHTHLQQHSSIQGGCRHHTDTSPRFGRISRGKGWTSCDIANRGAISQTDQTAPGETPIISHQTIASHIGLSNRWSFSTTKQQRRTPIWGEARGTRNPAGGLGTASFIAHDNHYRRTFFSFLILSRRKIFVARQHRTRRGEKFGNLFSGRNSLPRTRVKLNPLTGLGTCDCRLACCTRYVCDD